MADIVEIAGKEIDEAVDSLVSKLPITKIQLKQLTNEDVKKLDKLITKVKQSTDDNEKITAVIENAELLVKIIAKA